MPPIRINRKSWSDGNAVANILTFSPLMIEEPEARRRILAAVKAGSEGTEKVALSHALGRVLASDVFGMVDLPGFDNSSMDGYAVRAAEAGDGARLLVSGEQPAGEDRGLSLESGRAIRIFTGAPIPTGADAVVMQEDVRRVAGSDRIEIIEGVTFGENIRPRGGDVCAGQKIADAGTRLTPALIGLLASQGIDEIAVRLRPKVGIVSTGDEVVEAGSVPSDVLPSGCLYNSNGPMLEALVRELDAVPRRWHAPDEPEALRNTLEEALADSDFVLVAGGVSVGERDFVKETLAELGVTADFWRVRVKPGKPFVFGHRDREARPPVFVFGLPGNPVSAFVTFHIFAAPAMALWAGRISGDGQVDQLALHPWKARLAQALENPGDRPHYLRMRIDAATGELRPTGLQQSHALFGLSRADALLRLDAGESLAAGEEVTAWRW